jgi:hypothetical protein
MNPLRHEHEAPLLAEPVENPSILDALLESFHAHVQGDCRDADGALPTAVHQRET